MCFSHNHRVYSSSVRACIPCLGTNTLPLREVSEFEGLRRREGSSLSSSFALESPTLVWCAGYSLLIKKANIITLQPDRVMIRNGPSFGCVLMKDFLEVLAKKMKRNTTSFDNFSHMYVPPSVPLKQKPGEPLRAVNLFKHIQGMLTKDSTVVAETGDAWFNCQKVKLPEGCTYEFQMQYGSIGWSVGATLGYAQGAKDKRVIACIGDGSFQVTAQEVSTMIRNGQWSVIFLLNNGGYSIEVEIHDGPYNVIKNWNYTALVEDFHNGEGKLFTCKVRTEEELVDSIAKVHEEKVSASLEFYFTRMTPARSYLNVDLVLQQPIVDPRILTKQIDEGV